MLRRSIIISFVISYGVSHRDELSEDMQEHVNKSDLSYEGLLSFWSNAKQVTVMPHGASDFVIFLTRFFIDQPIAIVKPCLKKGKTMRDEDHDTYKKVLQMRLTGYCQMQILTWS